MNTRLAKLFTVPLCLAFFAMTGITQANSRLAPIEFNVTITRIRSDKTVNARTEAAQHLASLARRMSAKEVTDRFVTEISSLLDSPDDSVRFWVATALGNIGPPAKAAVPKLEEMLQKADCINGAITSADGIRFALIKMGVKPPPPPKCVRIAG